MRLHFFLFSLFTAMEAVHKIQVVEHGRELKRRTESEIRPLSL